jgi:hypothetical protein
MKDNQQQNENEEVAIRTGINAGDSGQYLGNGGATGGNNGGDDRGIMGSGT